MGSEYSPSLYRQIADRTPGDNFANVTLDARVKIKHFIRTCLYEFYKIGNTVQVMQLMVFYVMEMSDHPRKFSCGPHPTPKLFTKIMNFGIDSFNKIFFFFAEPSVL